MLESVYPIIIYCALYAYDHPINTCENKWYREEDADECHRKDDNPEVTMLFIEQHILVIYQIPEKATDPSNALFIEFFDSTRT
jgi:hypothetical protein